MRSIPPFTYPALFALLLLWSCNSSEPEAPVQNIVDSLPEVEVYPTVDEAITAANSFNSLGGENLDTNPLKAIEYYTKSIAVRNNIPTEQTLNPEQSLAVHDGIVKGYFNVALCYLEVNQFVPARAYINKSLEQIRLFEKEGYNEPKRTARAYHELGKIEGKEGNTQEALSLYTEEKIYWDQLPDENADKQEGVFNWLSDLSALYVDRREADKVISYAQKALDHAALYADNPYLQTGPTYNNLGYAYILKKDYPQAIKYLDMASETDAQMPALHNKAMALRLMGQYAEAHAVADKVNMHWDTLVKGGDNETAPMYKNNLAGSLSNKADIYIDQSDFAKALSLYEASIPYYYVDSTKSFSYDKPGLVEAYEGKAKSLKGLKRFDEAMQAYNEAIVLINRFKQSYDDAGSKARLAEITKKVFEGAIATGLLADADIEQLLSYSEQSKAFILLESIKKQQVVEGIDPQLMESERRLRTDLLDLERQLVNEQDAGKRLALVEQLKLRQGKLDALLKKLNANKRYRQLYEGIEAPALAEIRRQLLDSDQMMLEYFVGEQKTYLFAVPKKGEPQVFDIAIGQNDLAGMVQSCLAGIYGDYDTLRAHALAPHAASTDYAAIYTQNGATLFDLLFPKAIRGQLPQRLLIIPDDVLGYLPFDALLTSAPTAAQSTQYRNYKFLGQNHPISYSYSAALLKEMQKPRHRHELDKVLAFAYPNELDYFTDQVNELKAVWGNNRIDIKQNTETEKFIADEGKRYRFIHLATHGSVNDRDPDLSYLLMNDPKLQKQDSCLYLYELYGMALNADLVFTSACEAGTGQLYRGEGIMSLARGFSYAGAGSIVTTLWKINQQKANVLVESFYKSLLDDDNKMSKDVALFEAKKAYLKNAGHRDAAPYYWACFIPIGDMAPLKAGGRSMYWLWSAPALIVLLAALRMRKRRRNTT